MPSDREKEHEQRSGQHSPEVDPELLAEFVGRELTRDPENRVWRDERFIEWLAAEAREHYERTHRMSDAEFRRKGEEFRARVEARRLRVRQGGAPPLSERQNTGELPVEPVSEGPAPVVELGIAAGVGRELWDMPCTHYIELPPDIPRGRYLALNIVGESMAPLMHTGDTVLVRVDTRVRRNTVIVARHPDDGYVCKCVSRITRNTIELSSIEAGRPKITIPRDPACIVGTVVLVWCSHRA